jgi:hypothetical protein
MKLALICLFVFLTTSIWGAEEANIRELSGLAQDQKHWALGAAVYNTYHRRNYAKVISLCTAGLATRLDPTQRSFLFDYRAACYRDENQFDKALPDYNKAVELNPRNGLAHAGRAALYTRQGKRDAAMKDLDTAIRLNPRFFAAYSNRAQLHSTNGDLDHAIADWNSALQLNPKDPDSYIGRGIAYYHKGDLAKAKNDLDRGLRLPVLSSATRMGTFNELAWLHATAPEASFRNGRAAVFEATSAYKLKGSPDPYYLDTLAAAFAENGDFEKAVRYQEQAVTGKKLSPDERSKFQRRLELYHAHTPYRDDHKAYLARTREARAQAHGSGGD